LWVIIYHGILGEITMLNSRLIGIILLIFLTSCHFALDFEEDPETKGLCGNGIHDENELCESMLDFYELCSEYGHGGSGYVSCNTDCTINYDDCAESLCGNGVKDEGEWCDYNSPVDSQCADIDYGSTGALSCTSDCLWDISECSENSKCGDGVVDQFEECDVDSDTSCQDLNWGQGILTCTNFCRFDRSGCDSTSTCGNNIVEPYEECDYTVAIDENCSTYGYEEGGEAGLFCNEDCQLDFTPCGGLLCGNGVIDNFEWCDNGGDAGRIYDCQELGYDLGTLKCTDDCLWDTENCNGHSNCGDGIIDAGEECDSASLNGNSCRSLGYSNGELKCTNFCRLDPSECLINTCGDENDNCIPDSTISCEELGRGDGGPLHCNDSTCDWDYDFSSCTSPVAGTGATCISDNDCMEDSSCVWDVYSFKLSHGMCSRECTEHSDCDSIGGECMGVGVVSGYDFGYCLLSCQGDEECNLGQSCFNNFIDLYCIPDTV
jgi:hypothetical protein